MESNTFVRSHSGAGVANTDVSAYKDAIAKREQAKYIKRLEQRIGKLESAMNLLQKTVKEIS
jgi:hypothetical protein